MKLIILGNGARENIIAEKLANHEVLKVDNLDMIKKIENIDMIIASMEKDLVSGELEKLNIPFFGPSKNAAKIEGSKIFSKNFMLENNIKTSNFKSMDNLREAKKYFIGSFLKSKQVIKLDGLASGKGVFIPEKLKEGLDILEDIYRNDEKAKIVIEDRIYGKEVSVMGFCNGKDISLMPQIIDYKRIYDDDLGQNTGGMGSIGPVNILDNVMLENVKNDMLKVVKKLNFKGVLYGGLICKDKDYYFLEFNCRFGDPETQVALNLLDSDLYTIFESCIKEKDLNIKWKNKYCANVVLSHIDYPFSKLEDEVKIVKKDIDKDIDIYYSNNDGKKTKGGRVASISCTSDDLYFSLFKIYNNIHKISYPGVYYRRDIGYKYLLDNYKKSKTKKLKLAIITSSKGTSLEKLFDENLIELIVTNKNTVIIEKGIKHNIKTFYMPKIDYKKLINLFDNYMIDIIYAVGFMNIIPKFFCDYYKDKIFNIHPSLLPKYANSFSLKIHEKILDNKEIFSGCTLHKITEKIDAGEIMLQKSLKIDTNDKIVLKDKIQNLEKNILYDFLYFYRNIKVNYKDSGVDIEKGDKFIEIIKNKDIGSFCSINNIDNVLIASSTDGIGSKLELAKKYDKYEGLGFDLVAMCVNDLYARGVTPKIFLDYLAVNTLDIKVCSILIDSIKKACKVANISLVGGETAEMKSLYRYESFDLAGFSVGVVKGDIYPKINFIKSGYKLYALKSSGLHSNGFSLIRKLLTIHDYDIDKLLTKTIIYKDTPSIIEKYKKELLAIAHITGGGLIGNIKRVIPQNLKIKIDIKLEDVFLWVMEKSKMSYTEMLSTFNCGYGMVFIFDKEIENKDLCKIGYLY